MSWKTTPVKYLHIELSTYDKIFIESWNKNKIKDGKLTICTETCGKNSWLGKLYVTKS